ncbi:MAG: PEP-CTERM sorting domain-containing protein [Gammaproteobacteria bacterium]|nr:PEP-CTERM sorting domain-containing protein [Gammaproteobacteria bacterium]
MRLLGRRISRGLAATLACIALGAAPLTASANLLQGGIAFGGLFTTTGGTGLGDATGLNIGFSLVTAASGDFAPAAGINATYSPLTLNSSGTPVTPLWEVVAGAITYPFDLLDLSVDLQDADSLFLSGAGTLTATGFDPTPGAWTFSGQRGNIFLTLSSITGVVADADVPEPGTLGMLLLAALVSCAVILRRRRAAPFAAALALAVGTPVTASAITADPMIDPGSELAMFGSLAPTGGTDLASATGLTFASPVIIAAGANDFAFSVGGNATYFDFDFAAPVLGTILSFAGGGAFTATSVTVDVQTPTALGLTLDGVWSLGGFADTPGILRLTADSLFGLSTFSSAGIISVIPSVSPVPVPGALALFAPAIVALYTRRRRPRLAAARR